MRMPVTPHAAHREISIINEEVCELDAYLRQPPAHCEDSELDMLRVNRVCMLERRDWYRQHLSETKAAPVLSERGAALAESNRPPQHTTPMPGACA